MTQSIPQKNERPSRLQFVKRAAAQGGVETLPPVEGQHRTLKLDQIDVDPEQPRKDAGDVSELAASIRRHGLLHAIIVRPLGGDRYMVISGERRLRAHRQAGLPSIRAIVRTPDEQTRIELQLVENLHRKDLDPFEEADGYARLKAHHDFTDAEIARRVSKSRSRITELLSLTKIPFDLRQQCLRADISRDTLYLIARQSSREQMQRVIADAISGSSREFRRERARTGPPRLQTAKRPRRVFHTPHGVDVIVQSQSVSLSPDRVEHGLEAALTELRSKRAA